MPIIIRRSQLRKIDPQKIEADHPWDRSWYYYECPDGCEEFKSDIKFKKLYCIFCGKVMQRI